MTDTRRTSTEFPAALFGPAVWAAHFMSVYAAEGMLCVLSTPLAPGIVRATSIGLTVTALAAVLGFALWWRGRTRALQASDRAERIGVAMPLTLLAALGVAWTAIPIFTLPVCIGAGT